MSSPARGTWIEISSTSSSSLPSIVVPRKGDVDRNVVLEKTGETRKESSPARGTWIEIKGGGGLSSSKLASSPARGRG